MQSTVSPLPLKLPPGPKGYPVLGILPNIWSDPLKFFCEVAEECGDIARMGVGKFTLYLVSSPELIHYILHDNWQNYWKGEGISAAKIVVGEGLATSSGKLWQRQRRLIQPGFSSKRLAAYVPLFRRRTTEMVDAWEHRARTGRSFNVALEMQHLTLRIICEGMFGTDVTPAQETQISDATLVACSYIDYAAWSFLKVPRSVPTRRNRRFKKAATFLLGLVDSIVAARRRTGEQRDDMLGRLLSARDPETGRGMSDAQLRDEVMTLFVAGHETPANALAWTVYLLGKHPAIARQVTAEIDEVLGSSAPTPEDLPKLVTLDKVLKESLRLYPPGWTIVRTPYEDDVLGGYDVPANSPILLSQYVVHRHPKLWENPDAFDIERWTPERCAERPRYAYFPFGGGIRACLGEVFAMMMMKTIVAGILQRYRIELKPGHRVEPEASITLRPRWGVEVLVKKRT